MTITPADLEPVLSAPTPDAAEVAYRKLCAEFQLSLEECVELGRRIRECKGGVEE